MRETHPGPSDWMTRLRCLAIAAIVLAGCGWREAPHPAPASPVTLSYFRLGWSQPDELPAAERLSQAFTQQTGVRIKHPPVPETSLSQLDLSRKLLREGSTPPDVFGVDVIWSGALESEFLDLRPYFAKELADMDPQLVSGFSVGERLVAVPYQAQVGVLEYRVDLLRDYGYTRPPRTWDELETMATKIQAGERAKGKHEFWGYVWQGAPAESLTCNGLEWQAAEGGGHIIEGDHTISVNNPAVVRAWERAKKWIGWISPPSVVEYRELDSMNMFDSGLAAFSRNWGGATHGAVVKGVDQSRQVHWRESLLSGRVGYAGIPGGPGGRFGTLGGSGLAVSRHSSHSREAIEFIRFLLREQGRSGENQVGNVPAIAELHDLPLVLDASAEMNKSGIVARPSNTAGPSYELATRAYIAAVHSVLTGRKAAPQAAADLERELMKITGFKAGKVMRN